MTNDLVRLLLLAAVAFVAYNVLIKNDGPIKNEGVMHTDLSPFHGDVAGQHIQGIDSASDKKVINSQIVDVNRNNTNVLPPPQMSNGYAPVGNFEPNADFAQLDCFPKDQLVASDLLPPTGGFADSNPEGQGQLMDRNMFESAHHAGLNTQSNTLKNANRQLRSDPLIPRRDVGPWHQSTYEADTNRRQFEIGMV